LLRLYLERRGSNLYYKDAQINRKDGGGLYAPASIKSKGAVEFKRIIGDGQKRKREQTVVDRQSMTFDDLKFDDKDDDELTLQQLINEDSKSTGEPPLDSYKTSGIPQAKSIEMYELNEHLRKTKSSMEAAYIELGGRKKGT